MPIDHQDRLVLTANLWSLKEQPDPEQEWSLAEKVLAVNEGGFDAISCWAREYPGIVDLLRVNQLRYGGFFDAGKGDNFADKIEASLEVGNGPMNCQMGDHDTPLEEAVDIAVEILEVAEQLGAEVYIEVHRDTATETPEKSIALAESYFRRTGKPIRMNFDYSHPAVVKHLDRGNYSSRLFDQEQLFTNSGLWHIRPFNGHHCQIPISDGSGAFSPEYLALRPFIRDAFQRWIAANPGDREFWVVPELGPLSSGYGLSCFPNIWRDTVLLGRDLRTIWAELVV